MREQYSFTIDNFKFVSTNSEDFIVKSKVIPLFNKYKDTIVDDYWKDEDDTFIRLIDLVSPYFFTVFNPEDEFIGYMFLSDWRFEGSICSFHIVIDEKFHGKYTQKMSNKVADTLFNKFSIRRIDCIIPIYNKKVRAFAQYILKCEFEGIMKAYSVKNGKPLDYLRYARIRRETWAE